MPDAIRGHRARLAAALALVVAAACGKDAAPAVTTPATTSLGGMQQVASNDTVRQGTTLTTGPGYVHGTVMGPLEGPTTGDSLAAKVKLAGVTVTIYQLVRGADGAVSKGAQAGSNTTNAQGQFQLPTVPGGDYVVTFVPPTGSGYISTYATTTIHPQSADAPWWVTLPRK
jgi:hypothetical protein